MMSYRRQKLSSVTKKAKNMRMATMREMEISTKMGKRNISKVMARRNLNMSKEKSSPMMTGMQPRNTPV
jgi:hypothetical protein